MARELGEQTTDTGRAEVVNDWSKLQRLDTATLHMICYVHLFACSAIDSLRLWQVNWHATGAFLERLLGNLLTTQSSRLPQLIDLRHSATKTPIILTLHLQAFTKSHHYATRCSTPLSHSLTHYLSSDMNIPPTSPEGA